MLHSDDDDAAARRADAAGRPGPSAPTSGGPHPSSTEGAGDRGWVRGDDPGGDPETRPSWMGGPGYTPPPPGMAPHAPLPGAPPYPAATEEPPGPVGVRPPGTGPVRAVVAVALWAVVELALRFGVGTPPGPRALLRLAPGVALVVLITAGALWFAARPRRRPLWLLVVVAAPVYWVLRILVVAAGL